MKNYQFNLSISPERWLDYYRGTAKAVIARCSDGRTIQFPASLLQRFVSAEGISGTFVLTCDDNNQHAALSKLDHPR